MSMPSCSCLSKPWSSALHRGASDFCHSQAMAAKSAMQHVQVKLAMEDSSHIATLSKRCCSAHLLCYPSPSALHKLHAQLQQYPHAEHCHL
eukprot:6456814-Amphidinium_carterae.1